MKKSTLLLILIPFLYAHPEVNVELLKWSPGRVVRETVLAEHSKIDTKKARSYPNTTTLAFISNEFPRGYRLARKTAKRIDIVSPQWFEIDLFMTNHGEPTIAEIDGRDKIDFDIMMDLKKSNPEILFMPEFAFRPVSGEVLETVVNNEVFGNKMGREIRRFCEEFGFDGAVVQFSSALRVLAGGYSDLRLNLFESMAQIGKELRKFGLKSVYTLPPPVSPVFTKQGFVEYVSGVKIQDCKILLDAFDFVHLETWNIYSDGGRRPDFTRASMSVEVCSNSPKLILGLNFGGARYPYKEYRERSLENWVTKRMDGKEFIALLREPEAQFVFDEISKEHVVMIESKNVIAYFPSMTSLEYRIEYAKQLNVGVAFWDYGQGLDYFGNLI